MAAETVLLFPTTVAKYWRPTPENEKETWFDLYLKHSDNEGKSHDFLGFEELHLEPSVENFYSKTLKLGLDQYFNALKIMQEDFDVYVTKSFFNVTTQQSINEHDHAENHLSFVYYPHIGEGLERNLMVRTNNYKHPNEPYPQFFANIVKPGHWDSLNSLYMRLPVKEGDLYIFPSDLRHNIEHKPGDTNQNQVGMKGYNSREELLNSRFCVAGDMMIIRNHTRAYQRMLPPIDKWQKI